MAEIAWSEVLALAPELSKVDPEVGVDCAAYANRALVPSIFGGEESPTLRMARMYLAAHYGSVSRSKGIPGPVVSSKAGDLSRSYAGPPVDAHRLETTAYGKAFLSLVDRSPARGPVPT